MYTDPTGYYSLGEVTGTLTVHSIVSTMVVGGVSYAALNSFIRFARGEETTPGDYLKDFVQV